MLEFVGIFNIIQNKETNKNQAFHKWMLSISQVSTCWNIFFPLKIMSNHHRERKKILRLCAIQFDRTYEYEWLIMYCDFNKIFYITLAFHHRNCVRKRMSYEIFTRRIKQHCWVLLRKVNMHLAPFKKCIEMQFS